MKLRTNNRFRGLKVSRQRFKGKYNDCGYVEFCSGHTKVRKLTDIEIAEFQQCVQRAITGDVPRAKPL